MKRNLLALSAVLVFGIGLASCNKCTTCTDCEVVPGATVDQEYEFCQNDFEKKSDYNAAIEELEDESLLGCTCN